MRPETRSYPVLEWRFVIVDHRVLSFVIPIRAKKKEDALELHEFGTYSARIDLPLRNVHVHSLSSPNSNVDYP